MSFDELPEVEEKSDLVDLTAQYDGDSTLSRFSPVVEGVEQIFVDFIDPGIVDAEDPFDYMDAYELWFDVDSGERVEEPSWFTENERRFKKFAEQIGNKNFEGLHIDSIPVSLTRRIEDRSGVDTSNPYLFVGEDGVVREVIFEELVKLLMNEGKISHPEFYLEMA